MSTNVADSLLTEALQVPWAITEAGLALILSVLTRTNVSVEALEKDRGAPLSNERNAEVTIRDGVAIIPIAGPLVRRGDFFSRVSGATSYDRIASDLAIAMEAPGVRAILLNIDSPGGEVTGVSDLAAMIRAAAGKKRVVAHTDGMAASAAYWLASAASEIIASPTSIVGSIGVRMAMSKQKTSATDRYTTFEFVSSQSPKKNADPETDAGRAQIQQTIDDLAGVFVETVAAQRGVSVETVLADFGQGDVFVGQRALDAGMIDGLGTFEDTLARLASRTITSTSRVGVPRAVAIPPSPLNASGDSMSLKATNPGAADQDEPKFTAAELDARVAAARKEASAEQLSRMTALLELSATIEPSLRTAALDGTTTAEQYGFAQFRAMKAAAAASGDKEQAAKEKYIEAQAGHEKTIADSGVQVPKAKAVEPTPDATDVKKSRLLDAAKRTGALKTTPV